MTREGYTIATHYAHQQLGAMIGAKRVAVNRTLNEFVKAGVVELKRGYIYVKDVGPRSMLPAGNYEGVGKG
jgi:CRP-like cAMP-binding protein